MLQVLRQFAALFQRNSTGSAAAMWDAASGAGKRTKNWRAPSTDFAPITNPAIIRERARDAYRNNPWARRAVDVLVANVIGAGIKPMPAGANKAGLLRAWDRWTDTADFDGRFDFYGFQAAALRTCAVDGEAIIRLVYGEPLQLQLLGPEYLDLSVVNDNTLNGIEYDEAGRRVAYHLFTKHPAQALNPVSVRVPAAQVVHLFWPVQAGAQRGVSWLAPALLNLKELKEYLEAALVRAKTAALFAGYVRSGNGRNPLNGEGDAPVLEPGSMSFLQPEEDVTFSKPPDIEGGFDPFIRNQLRAVASALGLPYELLANDVSQVTFASGRHALLEFRRQLEAIQHHLVVFQLCRPVWNLWERLALLSGAAPSDSVRWVAPLPEMLDAQAETTALVQKIRAGLIPRSEVVASHGMDIDVLDGELAKDNARVDLLGLVLDCDPRNTNAQGQRQQEAERKLTNE